MDVPHTVDSLEEELARARKLSVEELADAIESIGFECTHCGACCRAEPGCDDPTARPSYSDATHAESFPAAGGEAHTATIFPDEVRSLLSGQNEATDWRDVARPMPYGLSPTEGGELEGETFEWALQTDACGDCVFYDDVADDTGGCTVHADRPLICQTYPFSVTLDGTSQPMGEAVDEAGVVRAHECEGLGREIDRADAERLADALRERAVHELEEAIAVRDAYEPAAEPGAVVVHDSEGAKRPDGSSR